MPDLVIGYLHLNDGFARHVLPGSLFLVYGIWSSFLVLFRYYKAVLLNPGTYTSTLLFTERGRKPYDIYFMLIAPTIGLPFEMYYASMQWKTKILHHSTAYIFPEFVGLTLILRHRNWKIPEGAEYLMYAMQFLNHGTLIWFHLERAPLDTAVSIRQIFPVITILHTFFCYLAAGLITSIVVELSHPEHIAAALAKQLFLVSYGCWYFVVASLIHPLWGDIDGEDREYIHMVPVYFGWNMIFAMGILVMIGTWQYRKVRNFKEGGSTRYHLITDSVLA